MTSSQSLRIRRLALCALVLGTSACTRRETYPPNTSQKADTEFIRFVDKGGGEGVLETAIATYEGKNGERVELISAVHIADAAYYRRLQGLFAGYDALLYEMVKPRGSAPAGPDRKAATESGSVISMFQRFMRDTLELEFQLEGIDYRQRNFVHADLDAETFTRLSEERGESLLGLMLKFALKELARGKDGESASDPAVGLKLLTALFLPDRARALKYLLAKELQNMEEMLAGLNDGEGTVILTERNKQLMRVLVERLERGDRKIGVFFGGAHLHDVEERIFREIGLRRTGVRWEPAWVIERDEK